MSLKIAVFTAVIGGIDAPRDAPLQNIPVDFYYYTEGAPGVVGNDRTQALWYKTHIVFDERYDIVIWLDGKIQVLALDFIEQVVNALGTNEVSVLKHHERACIYQEVDHIEHCMRKGNKYLLTRYQNKPIRAQVEAYRYFGYPKNNGLGDCAIIAAWAIPKTQEIFEAWWKDVYKLNGFDQVALPFYCWRAGVEISPIVFKPASFIDVPHTVLK